MSLRRRDTLALGAGLPLAALAQAAPGPAGPNGTPRKTLRYAFPVAETGFDPAQLSDVYSRTVIGHIFEALVAYDPIARPARLRPLTAAEMPLASDGWRTWTVRIRPGILFADDPVFQGRPRELVAEDYVYSYKRLADPATKSPVWGTVEQYGLLGLGALRREAIQHKKPFDYDRPIEGLRALDRYTLQFRLAEPAPRFVAAMLAGNGIFGAVAREVVEHHGAKISEHPVGTGPFRLVQWRRSSFIALERNPGFREMFYDAEPEPDDAEGQAILARLKGRRIPMLDRVEVAIIEEQQPRWLSFLQRGADLMDLLPAEFVDQATPGGQLAPNLAKQGIQARRMLRADLVMTVYNMDDPLVGGYTPEKVALRRAINLAVDLEREIRLVRRGQMVPAQSPLIPHTGAYDPAYKGENSEYSVARARALLDLYGYLDRDGDGWRELPDGRPLVLLKNTEPEQLSRQLDEQWRRNLAAIGLKVEFRTAKWPENLKAARNGKFMIWGVGSTAGSPDSIGILQRFYGPQVGGQNLSRFKLAAFDKLFERLLVMPDGPERLQGFRLAQRLATAYAPYKLHGHRIATDLAQPWLLGYRRPVFWQNFWESVDIDGALRPPPTH